MRQESTCYVKGKSDGSSEAIVGGEGLIRCHIRVVTTCTNFKEGMARERGRRHEEM